MGREEPLLSPAVLTINAVAVVLFVVSLVRDRRRTSDALRYAARSALNLAPSLLSVLMVIGVLLGFVPQSFIATVLGEGSGMLGVMTAVALGSVLHIPALVAFPLAASLVRVGASSLTVAVFISTLTMVGVVTLPLEFRVVGRRFALLRNGLSLVSAVLVGLLVGAVLR